MRGKHILILVLSSAALLPASAQTVYRCGNSYSQTPCPGGNPIEASDKRDRTQKVQADAAVRRDLKAAEALEKNRVRQETTQARATRQTAMTSGNDIPLQEVTTDQAYEGKRKKPEFFTARTLDPQKKKTEAGHGKPAKAPTADTRP